MSFCNVKTKMMMRNSNAALSFKLKTTVSSAGRENQEALRGGGGGGSKGGRYEEFGGEENQAGQVGGSLSQEAVPLCFSQQTSLSFYIAYMLTQIMQLKRSRV